MCHGLEMAYNKIYKTKHIIQSLVDKNVQRWRCKLPKFLYIKWTLDKEWGNVLIVWMQSTDIPEAMSKLLNVPARLQPWYDLRCILLKIVHYLLVYNISSFSSWHIIFWLSQVFLVLFLMWWNTDVEFSMIKYMFW
jgi:hypothetical protein